MNKRKALSILMALSISITCFMNTNTYATENEQTIMELKLGSTSAKINGKLFKVEKPYISNKIVMVPLAWITTAIGAEINQMGKKKINIVYRDMETEIEIGSKSYLVDSKSYRLTVAPVIKNGRTMVPLEFISKNFPVLVKTDIKKGSLKLILKDDGALSDLSFLTGGISSAKLGNSYYGWSISIPAGSRIISNSFKSDKVGITNEGRSLYFEIYVEDKKDKTLTELYNDVKYNGGIDDSKIDLNAVNPYFQYTTISEYDESLRVNVFEKGNYFYYLTINNYDSLVTPDQLVSDKYYQNIVNSFSLEYKGNVKGIEDISKVKSGEASFYNYISLNSSKYLPWSIVIPVSWNQLTNNSDPLSTNLGLDNKHYMKITANTLGASDSLAEYAEEIKNKYDKYFNKKVYSFIGTDSITVADTEAKRIKFRLKQADKDYLIDELYFKKNEFVYEISIKLPENEYEKFISHFINTVNKMNFYKVNMADYGKDVEKYTNKYSQVPVSKESGLYDYVNKTCGWSAQLPGYWMKDRAEDNFDVTFENPNTNAYISINALEKNSVSKTLSDDEKFNMLMTLKNVYKVKPEVSILNDKGYEVRTYTYRIENEDKDLYSNVKCYCFESDKYFYSYTAVTADLTETDAAVKEVEDIWKSFNLDK